MFGGLKTYPYLCNLNIISQMKKLLTFFIFLTTISCSNDKDNVVLTVYTYSHDATEMDLFNKINHFRDSIGVGQLTLVEHVSFKCEEHNQYMITNNVYNNDYFYDRSENIKQVCHATKVSELIAYNYMTNKSAIAAWANTPNCLNILNNQEFVRIGLSVRQNNNKKYYTVIFLN